MPPFSKEAQLVHDYEPAAGAPTTKTLPGYPLVTLNNASRMRQFLEQELWCKDLETMAPRLWIMTTFSSANIHPLHRQRVKGREIVVTEEPRLHLVWIHVRIFVKPLPRYLLSQTFWKTHLDAGSTQAGYSRSDLFKVATGFLRTYRYLIQHESDFHIAQQDDFRLVPKDIDWPSFCRFVLELSHIDNAAVSKRYYYGELRLTRLNLYALLLLRKFHFEQVHGQYGDFFRRLYGPVVLAADQLEASHWEAMWHVSRYFSIISLMAAAIVSLWFVVLWLWIFLDEWIYTARQKLRKKQKA
ncbi:hypothetical protein PSPO01_04009 [Paraphaeosphaeria sporulosa]